MKSIFNVNARFAWAAGLGLLLFSQVSLARGLPEFTRLVEQYAPTVVNISTTQKNPHRAFLPKGIEIPEIPPDSPFYEFFKRFLGEDHGQGDDIEPFDAQSLGSGLIISADGYIVTNYHVISEADEIIVRLSDRRELMAKTIGTDERSDLALLKIEASGLPVARLGHSSELKVGEWVLAIGSPFGFDHSVTAGIVSAKGRSLPSENYVPFIQTDVAINPGNSGGPLINLDGEVVGVNSQIYSRTGGFMGLSFAIPVDVVTEVVEQLKTKGRVSRGWLGVLIQDVTRELAESFGMERPRGALIAKVLPNSPATKAGFRVGDIVLGFNGRTVNHSSDLPPIVGGTPVGKEVPVDILRNGKSLTLQVTIDELPEDDAIELSSRGGQPKAKSERRLGLSVIDPTAEQREQLEAPENGVLVEKVTAGPAHQAGIREGDIILMVNNVKVRDSGHFKQLVDDLPAGKAVPILVQRGGNPIFLALKAR